jgi:hypothetical protein
MSRQRQRHLKRQPTEEAIRIAVSDFVGAAGSVDVQRMSHDGQADDVLVQIDLVHPASGSTLGLFRRELARIVRHAASSEDPLHDWLVVIESRGEVLARIAPRDEPEEKPDV